MELPPTHIGGGPVVRYLALDPHHRASGACEHVLAESGPGDIRALAIVRDEPSGGYLLFYCDSAWNVFADTWHETIDGAISQANFEFEGIEQAWSTLQHPDS